MLSFFSGELTERFKYDEQTQCYDKEPSKLEKIVGKVHKQN